MRMEKPEVGVEASIQLVAGLPLHVRVRGSLGVPLLRILMQGTQVVVVSYLGDLRSRQRLTWAGGASIIDRRDRPDEGKW